MFRYKTQTYYLYTRLKIKHPILSKEIIYTVIFFNHRYYASNTDTWPALSDTGVLFTNIGSTA